MSDGILPSGEAYLCGVDLRGSGLGEDYKALYRTRGGPMEHLAPRCSWDDLVSSGRKTPKPAGRRVRGLIDDLLQIYPLRPLPRCDAKRR